MRPVKFERVMVGGGNAGEVVLAAPEDFTVTMTPTQARWLAATLTEYADKTEARDTPLK